MSLDGTYNGLLDSMASWLNRDDLTPYLPDFVALFEAEFERDVRVREMLVRAVTVPPADEPRENLPGDFLELKSLQFNSNPPVVPEQATSAWIRAYRRQSGAEQGVPTFYTIEGNQFLFNRTPVGTELEIVYYATLPRLGPSQDTNWLLSGHPDIYLYGSLKHSAPFLKDDERIALWGALTDSAIQALLRRDVRGQFNAAPVRIRSRRVMP